MEWNENITGLQHIGIPTNDMDKTVDFYQKIGFEIAHEAMDGEVRVVFLKLKDLVLETYENKAAALCDGAVDHIALNVMNIEEARGHFVCFRKSMDQTIDLLPFGSILDQFTF